MTGRDEREMARLRTLIAIATARARTGSASGVGSTAVDLALPTLAEAARGLRSTRWRRLRHRREFELVELLLRRIDRLGRSRSLNAAELQLLGHAISVIRFGVPCNLTWYMHLADVVDDGLVSERVLRAALRTDAADVDLLGRVKLQISSTQARVGWWLGVLALAVAAGMANRAYLVGSNAAVLPLRLLIFANTSLPAVLAGLWFIGPRRWAAENVLCSTGLWKPEASAARDRGNH